MKSRPARFMRRSWLFQFGALAAMFALLHPLFHRMLRARESAFMDSFALDGVFSFSPVWALLILFVLLLVFDRRVRWKRTGGRWLRPFFIVSILWITWSVGALGVNYYTGQPYWLDRILLLVLFLLSIKTPAFVVPLLIGLLFFQAQQRISAGQLEITDRFPLFDMQVILVAWLALRLWLPMRARTLLWFLLAVQAVNYLAPGIAKMTVGGDFRPLEWWTSNPMHMFPATSSHHGWFFWFEPSTVESIIRMTLLIAPLIGAFTFFVEIVCIPMSLFRRGAMIALTAQIMLHLGIFSMTGIFFWKWIALDAALLWAVGRSRPRRDWRRVAAMALLIAAYPLYHTPRYLGWMDCSVSEQYFFEVQTPDQKWYRVEQSDMSPCDITFEQGEFHYVNREKVVCRIWGTIHEYDLAATVNATRSEAEVREVIAQRGQVHYNEKRAADLDKFLVTWFGNVSEAQGRYKWFKVLVAPNHMQARSGEPRYDFETPVQRVRIRFQRSYWDGERLALIDDTIVREIHIPPR